MINGRKTVGINVVHAGWIHYHYGHNDITVSVILLYIGAWMLAIVSTWTPSLCCSNCIWLLITILAHFQDAILWLSAVISYEQLEDAMKNALEVILPNAVCIFAITVHKCLCA